jgi:acylphosphatase
MENSAFLAYAEGTVQGVGFRYFTYREAQAFDIVGYVRNLPDGRVEVYAEGPKADLDSFIEILRQGPRFGNVENLEVQWKQPQGKYKQFRIESGYGF